MTLGIGEPFTTTVTISLVFALILALPFVLYQVYGFLMPALHPHERRQIRGLVLSIPFQFVAGVLFGYFVVLPAALHFFQNFNSDQFNVLVQANQYYKFAATTLLAMGLLFQVPVGIVAITRAGLVTPRRLRKNRRYAVLACGAVAACCRATRSPCCSRPCRCISCSNSAFCSPARPSAARARVPTAPPSRVTELTQLASDPVQPRSANERSQSNTTDGGQS